MVVYTEEESGEHLEEQADNGILKTFVKVHHGQTGDCVDPGSWTLGTFKHL